MRVSAPDGQEYQFLTNGLWNIIVGITTVGYGEFAPYSHYGRGVLIFSCLIGTLLVSLIVVSLSSFISFDNEEEEAYMILNRKILRKKLNDSCQNIIRLNLKIHDVKKTYENKNDPPTQEHIGYIFELKTHTHNKFKYKREIDRMVINKELDKINLIDSKFKENSKIIKNCFSRINEIALRIKKMKRSQNVLLKNIEDCIRLNSY